MENTLLNLIPAAYLPEIHLSQYDVGRTITFTLKDGASDYSVPSGASVKVKATKPSGFGFEVACTFNGGTVTLVTTDTMTPENGRFPAELSIVSGNTTIGTSNFIFNIERSPHPEGTTDGDASTIIPELTLLVERIEAAAEDVDEKSELFLNLSAEAETLEAGSPATASYSDGVLTLGIPRGYDGDDTKADAIVKSASGEVASFTDGGNGLLVKSLNVNIVPIQSGSGDPSPSNVRPISGYEGVNVTRTGKNLFSSHLNSGLIGITVGSDDTTVTASNRYGYSDKIDASKPLTIMFKSTDMTRFEYICVMRYVNGIATERPISTTTSATLVQGGTISGVEGSYIRIIAGADGSHAVGNTISGEVQVELGSTATAYEPYNGTTYTTSLGQTVYGGTLDVVSGELTINKALATIGSLNWAMNRTNIFEATISGLKYASYGTMPNIISSAYKTITARNGGDMPSASDNSITTNASDPIVYIKDTAYSSASDFKTGRSSQTIVYELATPITTTLTPTQVTTLLGYNNIWADSGSVEVEYRADTTLAYNELLSLIASLS